MHFIRSLLLRMGGLRLLCQKVYPILFFFGLISFFGNSSCWARQGVDFQLQLGNPTSAGSDTNNHTNYLIQRSQYAMDYNDTTHQANWVSWSYTTNDTGSTSRQNSFTADTNLPSGFYQVRTNSFDNPYQRGHMCPSADRTTSVADNDATFLMSNMIPQYGNNNTGVWATFEIYARSLASGGNEILNICGPSDFTGSTLSVNPMKIPGSVWKIVVVASPGTNAVSGRVGTNSTVIAIKTPNDSSVVNNWSQYTTSISQLEADTGFTFLTGLPRAVATYLKQIVHGQPVPALPYISSFSPSSGGAGSTVTLTGVNFASSTPVVKFNGVTAVASVSGGGTQISATVPAGASSGAITVQTTIGLAASTADFSVSASSPAILLSTNSLAGFGANYGGASSTQSYTVSGTSLTGNLTLAAPAGYEISLTNGSSFTNNLVLNQVGGTVATTSIFVRLSATTPAGSVNGSIAHSSTGVTSQNLALSGTVAKAAPVITWANPASISYGTALSGTQLNATSSVTGTFSYNPTNGALLGAGTNLLTAIFTAGDTNNYISPSTNTVNLVVAKATPAITNLPTASAITFGQALSNSVLSGGSASVAGSFAFTAPATVPSATGSQPVTFTPADLSNYNSVTSNVTVTVNAASATLVLGNLTQTYNGSARTVTVSTTPAGLGTSVTYNGSGAAPTNAGTYTVVATVTDPGYSASVTNTLTVLKASPVITWSNPAGITYGSLLSATQLNATSTVAGTYAYNPTNGALLNAGTNTLSVVFRATDSNNYVSPLTNTVALVVAKATPSITAPPTASAITAGQALSNSVLSGGSASVAGGFTFTAPTTVPSVTGSQGVTFTPMDSENYNTVTTYVTVTVNPPPVSLAFTPSAVGVFSTTSGTASTNQSYNLSGSGLSGGLSVTAPAGFEISLTNGSGYVSSLSLIPTGGSLTAGPIYVRISSTNSAGVLQGALLHNGGGITNQGISLTGVVFATNANSPVTLAKWTFETLGLTNTNSSYGPVYPEVGLQTNSARASALHLSSNTIYSMPTGNGSARSFSCDKWTTNDYFQFALSSVRFRNLSLRFDHYSSSTGPLEFRIEISTDGTNFNSFTNYDVPRSNASSAYIWYTNSYVSNSTLSFDLRSMNQIADKTNLVFRLVQRSANSINGSTVGAGGTSRVDNFEVTATALDTNPPVWILSGGAAINLTVGGVWSDPGASALDAEDGNLSASVSGTVNPNVLGSYALTYSATDSAGNSSSTNRVVNVVLNSANSMTADSDGNGMPDLVEYALGGSATGNAPSILPSSTMVGTNFRISFLARTNDSNLVIRPVVSTNLSQSNGWVTNGIAKTAGVATNNGFEMQTWETPVGSAVQKFLKINISR